MQLPPAVRSWLGRQVQDALQHWPRGTFFAQNPDNYHITLLSDIAVALGEQRHDAPAVRKVVEKRKKATKAAADPMEPPVYMGHTTLAVAYGALTVYDLCKPIELHFDADPPLNNVMLAARI